MKNNYLKILDVKEKINTDSEEEVYSEIKKLMEDKGYSMPSFEYLKNPTN